MYTLKAELKAEEYKKDLIEDIQLLQCGLNIEKSTYSDLEVFSIKYLESLKEKLIKHVF